METWYTSRMPSKAYYDHLIESFKKLPPADRERLAKQAQAHVDKLDRKSAPKTIVVLVLPAFDFFTKQPDPPHVKKTLARFTDKAGIEYVVCSDRPGKAWFVFASAAGIMGKGTRASNTLRTTVKAKGEEWVKAVEAGKVRVGG